MENPDGTHCETSELSLNAGDTLVWSWNRGDLKNCYNMEVTKNTKLFIKTSSEGDFCPKQVLVRPVNGPDYITNDIYGWYNKDNTNNRMHELHESKSNAIYYLLNLIFLTQVG